MVDKLSFKLLDEYEKGKTNLDLAMEKIIDNFNFLEPKLSSNQDYSSDIETLLISVMKFMDVLKDFLIDFDYPDFESHLKSQRKYYDKAYQLRLSQNYEAAVFISFFQSWWSEIVSDEGHQIKGYFRNIHKPG